MSTVVEVQFLLSSVAEFRVGDDGALYASLPIGMEDEGEEDDGEANFTPVGGTLKRLADVQSVLPAGWRATWTGGSLNMMTVRVARWDAPRRRSATIATSLAE